MTCYYIWGKTRSRKTSWVYEREPDVYRVCEGNTGMWWTGYHNQEAVLFDDFRGTAPLHIMLQWLDGHPVQVPIHGGYANLSATRIYVTSNVPIENLYRNCDQETRDAFKARFHHIVKKGDDATEASGNTSHSFF